MFMESQKCPQQATWMLSVVKVGQTSQLLTSLPSSFSWRCSEQTESLSQIHSGNSNCCLKEVRFQPIVSLFNPVKLLSSSWVAFYLWNNLLSLIHLSWNLTTTTHHGKNKANRLNTLQACTMRESGRLRWDRLQHAVALCHTDRAELLQSFYKSQACHLLQTKFYLWEEKPVSWNAELTLSTEPSRPFSGSYEHLLYITNTPLTLRDSALPFSL